MVLVLVVVDNGMGAFLDECACTLLNSRLQLVKLSLRHKFRTDGGGHGLEQMVEVVNTEFDSGRMVLVPRHSTATMDDESLEGKVMLTTKVVSGGGGLGLQAAAAVATGGHGGNEFPGERLCPGIINGGGGGSYFSYNPNDVLR